MNFEAMWFLLKDKIEEKNSWGKKMLLEEMKKMEIREVKGGK